jgi:hypothetical protein
MDRDLHVDGWMRRGRRTQRQCFVAGGGLPYGHRRGCPVAVSDAFAPGDTFQSNIDRGAKSGARS